MKIRDVKIFTLAPQESWVCDRFTLEWNLHNPNSVSTSPYDCDILWLLASWCWNQIDYSKIKNNTRVCATIHHIVPEKFNESSKASWDFRDKIIDFYHVPCKKTRDQVSKLTKKPIYTFPFWVNENIWKDLNKEKARKNISLDVSDDTFVIGSFQRDTEGHDLSSPKLEKGPDIFFEAISEIKKDKNIHVLLGGWRRQYIINLLNNSNINFSYIELPTFSTINSMYNACDLYIVGSRHEGGPQSIMECSATRTPIYSTDVGIASEVLNTQGIFDINNIISIQSCQSDLPHNFKNVEKLFIRSGGFDDFLEMFNEEKYR